MVEIRTFDDDLERLLLANSEEVTAVRLKHPGRASRLGRSLRRNSHVDSLYLNLSKIRNDEDITTLLEFIESSNALKTIRLVGSPHDHGINTVAHRNLLVRLFCSTCLHNPNLDIPTACLVSMLNSTSLSVCGFLNCSLRFDSGNINDDETQWQQKIVGAFASTSVETLSFGLNNTNLNFFRMAHDGLKQNQSNRKRTLAITDCGLDNNAVEPMKILSNFLQDCPSPLCTIGFKSFDWSHDSLAPIAKGLAAHRELKRLGFDRCSFDNAAFLTLETICCYLQPHAVVSLDGNTNIPRNINAFMQNGGAMKAWLGIKKDFQVNGEDDLSLLLDFFKHRKCSLRKLILERLPEIQSEQLLRALPECRWLQILEIVDYQGREGSEELFRAKLLTAVRHNHSLRRLKIKNLPFTQSEKSAIRNYHLRNEKLPRLIRSMTNDQNKIATVPCLFRASAVATKGIGPGDIFEGLCRLGHWQQHDEVAGT